MSESDNVSPADLGPEPEGYWQPIHAEVDAWKAKYLEGQDDVGSN